MIVQPVLASPAAAPRRLVPPAPSRAATPVTGVDAAGVMAAADRAATWIVIPAFNEAAVITSVCRDVRARGYPVVVVDDCSTDGTWERVAALDVHRCRHIANLGQGAALQTGICYALERGARFVVTFDADGQHRADDIDRLIAPLVRGEADVALGSRFAAGGRTVAMPPLRRALLRAATLFTRFVTHLQVSDTHNGLRAFSRRAAGMLRITQPRMSHATQILSQVHGTGLRYREVPVTVVYSEYSLAKGQRMSNSFNILWDAAAEILKS